MKTIAACLIPLIALTTAGVAHAQKQPELPSAVISAAGGCNPSGCDTGTVPAAIGDLAPLAWRAFQLPPANRVGGLLIRPDYMLIEPAELTAYPPRFAHPLIRDELTWEQKFSRIEELPLLTLWQTNDAKIFFGVNSDGLAGLSFSQKPRQKTHLTGNGSERPTSRPVGPLSPPLAHAQSLTYEKKDLSGALASESK